MNFSFPALSKLSTPTPFGLLSRDQRMELQRALALYGTYFDSIDGAIGPRSMKAIGDIRFSEGSLVALGHLTPLAVQELSSAIAKFGQASAKHNLQTKEGRKAAIIEESYAQGFIKPQVAYVLASADWETNHTFEAKKEAYWLSDPDAWLRRHHPEYYPYYGRGLIQLTWQSNYERYSAILGIDLVKNPDLMLNFDVALFTLVHGLRIGFFTGKKLSDFITDKEVNYTAARRCVNGTDRATEIAVMARNYALELA